MTELLGPELVAHSIFRTRKLPDIFAMRRSHHTIVRKGLLCLLAMNIALAPMLVTANPLLFGGLSVLFRTAAPVTSTVSRFVVQRFGDSALYRIGAAEVHAWLGAGLLGVYFTNPEEPAPADAPADIALVDGPMIWLDSADSSVFKNPDARKYDDAVASGDKQPQPKASYDLAESLPSLPGNGSIGDIVKALGGAGFGQYKSSTKNRQLNFYVIDLGTTGTTATNCGSSNLDSKRPEGVTTAASCGQYSINGTLRWVAVWQTFDDFPCDPGYKKLVNGLCERDSTQPTTKPNNTPCEVLYTSAGWQKDPKNSNCSQVAIEVSGTGRGELSVESSEGNYTFHGDGKAPESITVNKSNGDKQTIDLNPNGAGQGKPTVEGVETVPGGAGGDGSDGSENPGGDGGSGETGGSTTGGGSCGGSGQVACRIDDGGFAGKSVDFTTAKEALSEGGDKLRRTIDEAAKNPAEVAWSAIFGSLRFGLPAADCRNPDLKFFENFELQIDVCGNEFIQMIRTLEEWGLYCWTLWYIWRRFLSSEQVAPVGD